MLRAALLPATGSSRPAHQPASLSLFISTRWPRPRLYSGRPMPVPSVHRFGRRSKLVDVVILQAGALGKQSLAVGSLIILVVMQLYTFLLDVTSPSSATCDTLVPFH